MPLSPSLPFVLVNALRQVDIVHFHHPFPLSEIAFALADTTAKTVVTWHADITRQRWAHFFYAPLVKRFLRRVDRIVATSQECLERSEFLRAVRSKCEVIPLGVDPDRFAVTPGVAKEAEAIRARYGKPLVLFVGRLVYYKGVRYLIEAMRDVNALCLIIGEGPCRKELEKASKACAVSDRVAFLGARSDEELPAYYHACDVFVLPSVEPAEAFGIVQLEAMACGKPVISTELPTGVRFVNLHGITGLRVPPRDPASLADGINNLLRDAELRDRLGSNGRKRVSEVFDVRMMVSAYLRLYESVAASPPS